jgi:hypothetical protein
MLDSGLSKQNGRNQLEKIRQRHVEVAGVAVLEHVVVEALLIAVSS